MTEKVDRVWWASFSSDEGPLGVVVADDLEDGDPKRFVQRLYDMGANPGGEILLALAPRRLLVEHDLWVLANMNRLIAVSELEAQGDRYKRVFLHELPEYLGDPDN